MSPRRVGRRRAVALAAASVALVGLAACSDRSSTAASPVTSARAATTTSTAATTAAAHGPSTGCGPGTATATPGETDQHLTSSGLDRTYIQHLPPKYGDATARAVVVDLHGFTEGSKIAAAATGLGPYGDTQDFVTITPQGTGNPAFWNATRTAGVVDDVRFLNDLLDHLESTLCLDTSRVFMTGLSNGAFMTSLAACDLADRVAAVAPVAGALDITPCRPTRHVPVLAIHGTADTFVPFTGGSGSSDSSLISSPVSDKVFANLVVKPIPDVMAAWAARNGCSSAFTTASLGTDVKIETWTGCPAGAEVELYVVEGGGHTWPGSAFYPKVENVVGRTSSTFAADAVMWAFFREHPLR